jgi:hypothetical protein
MYEFKVLHTFTGHSHRKKFVLYWGQYSTSVTSYVQTWRYSDQSQYITRETAIWHNSPIHIFTGDRKKTNHVLNIWTFKHITYLWKYVEKQFFCGYSILTSVFVTQLPSDAGLIYDKLQFHERYIELYFVLALKSGLFVCVRARVCACAHAHIFFTDCKTFVEVLQWFSIYWLVLYYVRCYTV